MNINEEQKQAIEHIGSPLVIYAGPGTGKTLVLQKKYEYLIKLGLIPQVILGITFTRSAAYELSERIGKSINIPPEMINIRTFHSICLYMIKKYYNEANLPPSFSIIEPQEQESTIKLCLQEKGLPFNHQHIFNIQQIISKIKKEMQPASPKDFIDEYAQIIYPMYQQKLRQYKKIDYDDIIKKATELLEIPRILQEYQSMYQYILLDEAQDTSIPQARIIYKLNCQDTTIVGDQNQSIYSFAGANPNFMSEFEKIMNSRVIYLKQNYRNPQNIINAATTVIQFNDNYVKNDLESTKDSYKKIGILHTTDERQEAVLIANTIEHNSLKDVTILYRRNENAREIEYALQSKGIPYQINGIHFYDRKEIKNIITIIKLIANPEDRDSFSKTLLFQQGIGRQTIEKIIEYADHTNTSLLESAKVKLNRITQEQHLTLKRVSDILLKIPTIPKKAQIEEITTTLVPELKHRVQKQNVESFKRIMLSSDEPLTKTLNYIQETHESPYVRLMTLHTAKGTENNIIFIIGTEEGLIPDENSFISQEMIQEERRLFYVGLTRTRETLILSHTQNRFINGYNLTQKPSRFLNEIPQKEFI